MTRPVDHRALATPPSRSHRLDITANRQARKWSRRALAGRILWSAARPLFAWSPRPLWGWRRMLLRLFGAQIGQDVRIHPSVSIEIPWNLCIGDQTAIGDAAILYALGSISIGAQVTISQYAHLCAGTHDLKRNDMALLKPPITVLDGAWICAVIGARSVVMKNVSAGLVVAGNPAKPLRRRPEYRQ
jgi:putative colanic acid biosynthesis acetyltransferase WcaF